MRHSTTEGRRGAPATGYCIFASRVGATLRHLASLGLDAPALLRGSGLAASDVDGGDNPRVVDAGTLLRVYENAVAQSGRADLGLCYGEATGVTEYGPIGYAMLSAATDLQAVNLALTFQRLYYGTMARMSLHHVQGRGLIRIDEALPGATGRRFFLEMLLAGFLRFNHALVGSQTQLLELRLAYPEPDYGARYPQLFGCPVRFAAPTTELVFDTGILARALPNSDEITARACEQVCRELLAQFDRGEPVVARVRRLLAESVGPAPSMAEVAVALGCHERTLHRRLREECSSFQQLKDEVARDRALIQLRDSQRSVNSVARDLGFDSPSNFRRAVRRWTGFSPQEWRRRWDAGSGVRVSKADSVPGMPVWN